MSISITREHAGLLELLDKIMIYGPLERTPASRSRQRNARCTDAAHFRRIDAIRARFRRGASARECDDNLSVL